MSGVILSSRTGFYPIRFQDSAFGDKSGDVPGGRDVEGGVPGGEAVGELPRGALLDGDLVAASPGKVDRRARRGDIEGDAQLTAGDRQAERPDLVGRVAVPGD